MIDKFPGLASPVGWVAASLVIVTLLLNLVSLGFLEHDQPDCNREAMSG
jgi:hypothetical protein